MKRTARGRFRGTALLLLAPGLLSAGCDRERPGFAEEAPPAMARLLEVRTTDFQAGPGRVLDTITNPYDDNARARAEGQRLYTWMNCGGCHGARGGGGIGPPFADGHWIYGGRPGQIFLSIYQGRPNGMPAYGNRVPEEGIWKIAAYVRSLAPDRGSEDEDLAPGPAGSMSRSENRQPDRTP